MSYVTKIFLYGNGRVVLGFHHVFVVVKMNDRTYRLLELTRGNGSTSSSLFGSSEIQIRQRTANSLKGALDERSDTDTSADEWHRESIQQTSWDKIQEVIDSYQGESYCVRVKDCRTFADDLLKVCGSSRRCSD
jgi:hypothetical protein